MEEILEQEILKQENNEITLEPMSDETIVEAMVEAPIGVYVKVNDKEYITEVNSSIFIKDLTGWTKIDEGFGDKYAHAQNNYFDKPLFDENGKYNYKLVENKIVEV